MFPKFHIRLGKHTIFIAYISNIVHSELSSTLEYVSYLCIHGGAYLLIYSGPGRGYNSLSFFQVTYQLKIITTAYFSVTMLDKQLCNNMQLTFSIFTAVLSLPPMALTVAPDGRSSPDTHHSQTTQYWSGARTPGTDWDSCGNQD